jgi:hypothetical protein
MGVCVGVCCLISLYDWCNSHVHVIIIYYQH